MMLVVGCLCSTNNDWLCVQLSGKCMRLMTTKHMNNEGSEKVSRQLSPQTTLTLNFLSDHGAAPHHSCNCHDSNFKPSCETAVKASCAKGYSFRRKGPCPKQGLRGLHGTKHNLQHYFYSFVISFLAIQNCLTGCCCTCIAFQASRTGSLRRYSFSRCIGNMNHKSED